jgi:hypothetical protein
LRPAIASFLASPVYPFIGKPQGSAVVSF